MSVAPRVVPNAASICIRECTAAHHAMRCALPATHHLHVLLQVLTKGQPNVSYICSRYYRAPELLFGATEYTCDT